MKRNGIDMLALARLGVHARLAELRAEIDGIKALLAADAPVPRRRKPRVRRSPAPRSVTARAAATLTTLDTRNGRMPAFGLRMSKTARLAQITATLRSDGPMTTSGLASRVGIGSRSFMRKLLHEASEQNSVTRADGLWRVTT